MSEPLVKVVMPDLKALAALTDKMKGLSDVLEITASTDGKMTLTINQTMVSSERKP